MMLKFLLEKEFKQILRNSFLPRMIIGYPLMAILVFPLAANFEVKNINLCVVDNDHSTYSRQLIQKISSGGYFKLTEVATDYNQGLKSIETDKSDIVLEIPSHFERDLVRNQNAKLMIAANAVNGTKGGLGSAYLSSVVGDFSNQVRSQWINPSQMTSGNSPIIEIVPQNKFNPHLSYSIFMVPALMVMILTMLCGFLPALNIVGEKESGTMEQINVTPVTKGIFILAKLIPYWIIGFIVLTISFGVAYFAYGLIPAGNLGIIYLFAAIYILGVSGFGLVISNYSNTMQQAMFVVFFFMLILILLSGLFTPVESMPQWAQLMTTINPLKYFMQVMRLVYLKGSGISELGSQLIALLSFAVVFNTLAILSYKKSN
ncbi:ABC transporter permease [Flavobacterium sp. 5]|uniref:ABC transporter permease n=1 Tax=Flavobacterium sp. 5 TaxID=2035199 RepID=UPI000CB66784|nr:ABC transporter permease [Flavobacterium sp. 5]PKB18447.1 ABC-2 type transport system permease protein [Flavobacterium sp. 5]